MREIAALPAMLGKLFLDFVLPKWALGALGGVVGYCLPDRAMRDAAVGAFVLIILDLVTGIASAGVSGKAISSAKLGRTVVKILGYASAVVVASVVARSVPGIYGAQGAVVTLMLTLIVCTEGVSVMENVRCMGIRLPDVLERMLTERLRAVASAPAEEERVEP